MSGSIGSSGPTRSFQSRLNRVAAVRAPIEAAKPEISVLPDWKQNIKYPAAIVGAALLGILAVFIARYVRFHMTGGTLAGDDPDITMMIDGGIAAACSFALFSMLRFSGAEFKAAQTFGIAAMVMTMHNAVHAAPEVFDVVFSEEWTDEVIAYTEPKSILFRGVSFVLSDDSPEAAESSAPVIRRAGKL